MRKYLALSAFAALSAISALGQQPAFEVASIRSAAQITPEMITSGKLHVGIKIDAGRVDIGYASLRDLVTQAYEVKPFQLTAPDWMAAQRFDILAKIPDGAAKEQVPAMLRALLEDRFKLVAHRENHDLPVYSLEVAKGGPKFTEAPAREVPAPDAPPKPEAKADMVIGTGDQQLRINRTGGGPGGAQLTMSTRETGAMKVAVGADGQMRMEVERMTMSSLAQQLTPMLDRPVIDHTDLKGEYSITLELSMQDMMAQMARTQGVPIATFGGPPGLGGAAGGPALAASDPSGGTIFTSVQKLGLKLEKQKAPMETIIVDSAEKNPTEN